MSTGTTIEAQVNELLAMIPAQMFSGCKIKGANSPDDGDARAEQAHQWLLALVAGANDKLDNCVLGLSGRIGAADDHGDFVFYLMAYDRDTATFSNAARFQGNLYQPALGAVDTMLQLVPAVEFRQCRQR
jgi:hypothetical protein